MEKSGQPDEVAIKEGLRVGGTTWATMRRGSSSTGTLPIALGSIAYQIEGDRLVAMMDAMECISYLPDVPSEVTPEMGPDLIQAASVSGSLATAISD